ncbi:MAG: hypothetical protein RI894_1555, partial [Bacteroidota bacterium]
MWLIFLVHKMKLKTNLSRFFYTNSPIFAVQNSIKMDSNHKLIFGLKVRQLRAERRLSFAELALATGMSISYLNEIEKGKKYPKDDKIMLLATALGTTAADLTSQQLSKQLSPIGTLLKSQFLNDLHLEIYGIEPNKVVAMLADAPSQVGAFISTLMQLSRNHSLQQEHFYFASLRSYQELHQNYFEELEQRADECIEEFSLAQNGKNVSTIDLYAILQNKYDYKINKTELQKHPELAPLRSYYKPETQVLMLRDDLSEPQERFVLAREIAYNYLQIKDRNLGSLPIEVKSFDQVLDNFKSAYFAVAILLHRDVLLADLRLFFGQRTWQPELLLLLLSKYQASPEMLMHRLTNLLPHYFGLSQLFFLRFSTKKDENEFYMTKELHLSRLHQPHANQNSEHYCRRWLSLTLLADLRTQQIEHNNQSHIAAAQRSQYIDSDGDEYLCFTIAKTATPSPDLNVTVTIGIQITPISQQRIKFLNDPTITRRQVNQTCERCALSDCAE